MNSLIVNSAVALSAFLTLACSYRVLKGPTAADRAVALDAIGSNVVALAVLYGIKTGRSLFVNIALMLALTGFVATLVVSMYIREGDIIV